MEIPFVNQSALRESARYQNDTRRRSFLFRDVLILYIMTGDRSIAGLHADFKCFNSTIVNFETVYELLKLH